MKRDTSKEASLFCALGRGGDSQAELLLFIPTACGDAGKGAIVSRERMAPFPKQRQRRCFPCAFGCKRVPWCKIFFILVK